LGFGKIGVGVVFAVAVVVVGNGVFWFWGTYGGRLLPASIWFRRPGVFNKTGTLGISAFFSWVHASFFWKDWGGFVGGSGFLEGGGYRCAFLG